MLAKHFFLIERLGQHVKLLMADSHHVPELQQH